MLKLLLDINYNIDNRFSKRLGLRKRIYSILTDAMMFTDKDDIANIFCEESVIDKELTALFVSYKKSYNLNTQVITDLCGNAIRVIDDLCYIMNERTVYCGSIYNNINRGKFIDRVLEEAFKDD